MTPKDVDEVPDSVFHFALDQVYWHIDERVFRIVGVVGIRVAPTTFHSRGSSGSIGSKGVEHGLQTDDEEGLGQSAILCSTWSTPPARSCTSGLECGLEHK